MASRRDCVHRAMGSSRLGGIDLSGGFGVTTLGNGAVGFGMTTLGGGAGGFVFTGTVNSLKDGARLRTWSCSGRRPTLDCLM